MSTPDYDQFAEDHQCLLIVIKQIGPQMNSKLFKFIYDRLSRLYEFKITDNKGMGFERTVCLRYKQSYSIENNDWGDFQAHRRLVGLITVARSFHDNEIESICELHNTIRDTYANTLFDSRCFIIRSTTPPNSESKQVEKIDSVNRLDDNLSGDNLSLDSSPNDTLDDKGEDDECKQSDSFNNVREITINDNESQLFDFHLGGQFFSSSDHTSFTSHVNRSSSSSSLSSQTSHSAVSSPLKSLPVQTSSQLNESDEQQLNSLPPSIVLNEDESTESNLNNAIKPGTRPRTHSRNKSLDSRILLATNQLGQNNFIAQNSSSIIANRTHSSSSTSLFSGTGRDTLPTSTTNEYVRYESDEQCCEQIEQRLREFITGLFWVLESKRLDRASEKTDKIPLLMAPFEKKDLIGLDTDTRSFRRKCMGRMRKHIADLSLLSGLPNESLLNYISAIEQLKAVNDRLWLAAAYEGYCVASLVLLYPKRWHHIQSLRSQFQFSNGVANDLISRSDYDQAKSEVGNLMRKLSAKDYTIDEALVNNKGLMKNILTVDQFYERYKEAASHYAQYRGAAILEFECSFKAARTLIFFDRYLKASDFIQNAVFVTFNQTSEEQIERLLRISHLYENIGFYRKASFYKRFAALKSVSVHTKTPNWENCYFLLLASLHGYGLTLDPTEYDRRMANNTINWSGIHVQLLQEMITTSIKMQNQTLAIRHLSFMLQCLFGHISHNQRQEFATKLSSLASKCGEGSPVTLKLNNGSAIPSVNFTKFPTVIFFKVEPLAPYLRPIKLKIKLTKEEENENSLKSSSPFIYTPLQLNRTPKSSKPISESITKVNFYWAEGNTGKITLNLHNYLPIELNISSIVMMTDGVVFEPKHDTALKIAPGHSCVDISLTGIPRSTGTLDILGYKIHALGIKSDCRLNQLPNARKLKLPSRFAVEVVARLPLMCAHCLGHSLSEEVRISNSLLPTSDLFPDMHISNSSFISLFTGQQSTYQIKLSNISRNLDELIDLVNIEVVFAKSTSAQLRKLIDIEWNCDDLNNLLPIGREMSATFDIVVSVKGDFVIQSNQTMLINQTYPLDKSSKLPNSQMHNIANNNNSKKSQVLGSTKLANFINEFQARKSSNENVPLSNQATTDLVEEEFATELFEPKIVELCIQFDYSGGPGLNSGFCRQTSVHFVIEVKPSVLITHWDVLSAEQSDECYLVFDTLNATEQELNLLYAQNKEMLIEPKEKCRIPVPIKRCPLNLSIIEEQMADNSHELCLYNRNKAKNLANKAKRSKDFLSFIFPTEQKLEAILAQCRLHLLDQIDLKWNLPLTDIGGAVLIDEVPYSKEMLKSLLIPPVQSEIELNSILFRSSFCEVGAKLGEHIPIKISLVNTSETTLYSLRLYLLCYQDYQNPSLTKVRNYNINTKLIVDGCDSICLPKLETNETYQHGCGLIFLYSGIYKLEVCCLPEEIFQQQRQQQLLNDSQGSPVDGCSLLSSVAGSASVGSVSAIGNQSLFKCLHTVEITVDEEL